MLTPLLVLGFLVLIYVVALGGLGRAGGWNGRRAATAMRSLKGANAALVVATLAAAETYFELATSAVSTAALAALLVSAGAAALGLALAPAIFTPLLGVLGLAAYLVGVFARRDVEQALWFLVTAAAMLVILSLGRGAGST